MSLAEAVIGWDVGGAHVKACLMRHGRVVEVVQWPCPLWQGPGRLEEVLAEAARRWPGLHAAHHAVTMTGEMVDHFADRQDGVTRLAALLAERLAPGSDRLRLLAGDAGWCGAGDAAAQWSQIASANWLATARHVALAMPAGDALLVDIGSTTTDLIAIRDGRVLTRARSDAERLASGELVYHGVVRTPLCAFARRIAWQGDELNVMNEFFATAADVYRLTGELDPAHDQHPAADGADKDATATRRRIARMIGLDARDASDIEWLDFARAWRREQVAELRGQVARVRAHHGLDDAATFVAAGCGAFLVAELAPATAPQRAYARDVARLAADAAPATAAWAQVCAPSVAVAALYERECR
jgi:probable H4MPT-linked C1 transfer pathway protein